MNNLIDYLLDELKSNPQTIKKVSSTFFILSVLLFVLCLLIFIDGTHYLKYLNKDPSIFKDFSIAILYISCYLFGLYFLTFLLEESAKGKMNLSIQSFRNFNPELFDKIRDEIFGIKQIEERIQSKSHIGYWLKKNKIVELWILENATGFEFRFKKELITQNIIKKDSNFKELPYEYWKEFYIAYPLTNADVQKGTKQFKNGINYIKNIVEQVETSSNKVFWLTIFFYSLLIILTISAITNYLLYSKIIFQ